MELRHRLTLPQFRVSAPSIITRITRDEADSDWKLRRARNWRSATSTCCIVHNCHDCFFRSKQFTSHCNLCSLRQLRVQILHCIEQEHYVAHRALRKVGAQREAFSSCSSPLTSQISCLEATMWQLGATSTSTTAYGNEATDYRTA